MAKDYTSTLNLPTTEFPMRAGLPQREPEMLKYWESIDLYNKMQENSKEKPLYILHDGPPFSNGNIHMGHALNKILKDFISVGIFLDIADGLGKLLVTAVASCFGEKIGGVGLRVGGGGDRASPTRGIRRAGRGYSYRNKWRVAGRASLSCGDREYVRRYSDHRDGSHTRHNRRRPGGYSLGYGRWVDG